MQNPIRDYFHLLGVGKLGADPTVPFDNEFHLLGINESESDQQIAHKAKALANSRSDEVNKRGNANAGKRLDILLRDKINQAGARFDGNEVKVREHREELHRARSRRLKDFAKDLCDSGKWTQEQATDMLETLANGIGITPDRLQSAVSEAIQTAGQWSVGPVPPLPAPTPVPVGPVGAPTPSKPPQDSFCIGNWEIPIWRLIPAVGLALGFINGWAGLAFGLAFLVLAWGKANSERKLNPGISVGNHLRWGLINGCIAAAPLLVVLVFHLGSNPPQSKWSGDWDTDWGKMTFAAGSSRVTGQYETRAGSGRVELKPSGEKQLDGTWCLAACTTPSETGRLRLVLDESGRAFKGWFTYGSDSQIQASDDAENQINGTRKAMK